MTATMNERVIAVSNLRAHTALGLVLGFCLLEALTLCVYSAGGYRPYPAAKPLSGGALCSNKASRCRREKCLPPAGGAY